ncbi:MAG: hypothetical protein JF595_03615 [Sphingomonadales bacterium]|nr:hypothetical protein [Sphingomonadales bacterium]
MLIEPAAASVSQLVYHAGLPGLHSAQFDLGRMFGALSPVIPPAWWSGFLSEQPRIARLLRLERGRKEKNFQAGLKTLNRPGTAENQGFGMAKARFSARCIRRI